MKQIFIRKYSEDKFEYFMSEDEYKNKLNREIEELKKINGDDCIDETDYELLEIIEVDEKECLSINDAITELFKYDSSDLLYTEERYKATKDEILKNKSLTYNIKGSSGDKFKLEFKLIEIDEEDIYESSIENLKINII